jgi:hypothetical protein
MSKLFTDLVGRNVSFSEQSEPNATRAKQIYGVYLIKPMDSTRVIQADLTLLGSFAGALIGLPSESIKERVAQSTLDEALRDALHEVLNIASRIVSIEARAVFQNMCTDPVYLSTGAQNTLRDPCYASYFSVKVDGYEGGAFSLLAPF